MTDNEQKGVYRKLSALVDNWLELHKGETFDLDMICRQLEIRERENRNLVTIKLAYEVKRGNLEKNNRIYRYINNNIIYIDWVNASENNTMGIRWPYGREDDTHFGFEEHIIISPADVIVIAGGSNFGKTCFCLNFLWENMDNFPCTLMGNEYTPAKFKRRVKRMDWADPLDENGNPKFELIERRDNWKDIIRPDNINIIDWIDIGENAYLIGKVIDGIQSKLRGGIALISLQKAPGKELGRGASYSMDLSSLYLSIDFERLTVVKAKEWKGRNPNKDMYGFTIVNSGTKFHNIREIKKCPLCYGTGHYRGGECDKCSGRGYVDK